MTIPFISFDDVDPLLEWADVMNAIEDGHKLPKASVADGFAYRGDDTLLSRSAWVDGLGVAIKGATIIPSNVSNGRPMISGGVMLFDDTTGELEALVDFHLVTKWKTAGDSLLAAKLLARSDSKNILIVGAGTVSTNMIDGYSTIYPDAKFHIWNRSPDKAVTLARELSNHHDISPVADLRRAVEHADLITCATMSSDPVVDGAWLQAGQHLNLIGAYRPDMRETNDAALTHSRIFVDSRETTIEHIGELKIPISEGVISASDIVADYYDITGGAFARQNDDEITLFKNGGGAHMDLMTAKMILRKWRKKTNC